MHIKFNLINTILNRHDEEDIERLTCTDVEQVRGQLKEKSMSRYYPVPINNFCHVKKPPSPYQRSVLDVTIELEIEFRQAIIAGNL